MRLLAFALAAAGARAQEAGPDLILNTCGPSAAAFQSWVWNASNSKFFLTATKGNNPPMCMDIAKSVRCSAPACESVYVATS